MALSGISVGGQLLSIPASAFAMDATSGSGGVIVVSGTAVTRLQSAAYETLRDATPPSLLSPFRSGLPPAVDVRRSRRIPPLAVQPRRTPTATAQVAVAGLGRRLGPRRLTARSASPSLRPVPLRPWWPLAEAQAHPSFPDPATSDAAGHDSASSQRAAPASLAFLRAAAPARIALPGVRTPTRSTLHGLHARHVRHCPPSSAPSPLRPPPAPSHVQHLLIALATS